MDTQNLVALGLLILLSLTDNVLSDDSSPCDANWEPYKDEKCLKIFDAPGLLTYNDAESSCKQLDGSNLVSIGLEEKQIFINDFLKSKNIFDNIWIGLKYINDTYKWSDNTELDYTNWASNSPKNDPNYCVQLQTDDSEFGKWSDVNCNKKNAVLCEKSQLWSLAKLQETVVNLMKNPVPIGFIYVQLPKEQPPQEIWPWMTWDDVSEDYSGVFFRVEGGNSSEFGSVQEGDSPRLVRAEMRSDGTPVFLKNEIPADGQQHVVFLNWYKFEDKADYRLFLTVSNSEVRPRNMAMKIWKRTQ